MLFDKEDSAGYLINHLARLFARELQDRIQPLGIATGQFPILLELWNGDGLTQRELLGEIDVEQATLANTLTRMERDGLIKRTKHPQDARAQQIWLTDKAKAIKADAYRAARQTNQEALAMLSESEKVIFLGLIQKVIGTMRSK
ncbi:MarR family transcriptional regulator [Roseibium polysiphoniae]|uniref:MarR family transcriptional regulator n=1 Tax=Roseibium polysiphoniae TaxID=2571221 RepID=A0A944CDG0_9HYPH|nr:MarR family transcriptional regulator [Roseibium polysiphoniae]MBS8261074.1 MarR family transcriptional regulator [Roseibium polysiphoniae]